MTGTGVGVGSGVEVASGVAVGGTGVSVAVGDVSKFERIWFLRESHPAVNTEIISMIKKSAVFGFIFNSISFITVIFSEACVK